LENIEQKKLLNAKNLKIEIFADGARIEEMIKMNNDPLIKGLTTNPTLMRKAGIENYKSFANDVLKQVKIKSISFEVFSDELDEMQRQAEEIASWGENVFVKIPITNTKGVSTAQLIKKLAANGIKVNITAIMNLEQVNGILESLNPNVPNYISIFAGRIADTGRDPIEIVTSAIKTLEPINSSKVIWASPRELLNVIQANDIGCHIITATSEILSKLHLIGYDLTSYSLDTVKMFHQDAIASKLKLNY
jgi:transaldolase